jgi:F0F1-type ATP synthase membrane subunit c/vacuolar-type H+-ATPase subunit K
MTHGIARGIATAAAYLVPNFSTLNVISAVAHQQSVSGQLVLQNTFYAVFYSAMALSGAVLIFERRNLK